MITKTTKRSFGKTLSRAQLAAAAGGASAYSVSYPGGRYQYADNGNGTTAVSKSYYGGRGYGRRSPIADRVEGNIDAAFRASGLRY